MTCVELAGNSMQQLIIKNRLKYLRTNSSNLEVIRIDGKVATSMNWLGIMVKYER